MSGTNLALIGVAVVAIFGAIGAFAVAFRRSQGGGEKQADPTAGVSSETRAADRSMEGVSVAPIQVEEDDEPEAEPED